MGTEHVFILDNCLYHPNSPINLPSTRCLTAKKSLMKMETQTKKLKLCLNTQLTFLCGLLDSFESYFQHQFQVFQSFFLMKDIAHSSHSNNILL
jgi:hypothetical protein